MPHNYMCHNYISLMKYLYVYVSAIGSKHRRQRLQGKLLSGLWACVCYGE